MVLQLSYLRIPNTGKTVFILRQGPGILVFTLMSPIVTPLPQVPPITDYNMDGHTYRYYHGDPLYPFGYGLSYSKFLYSNLVVSDTVVAGQDAVVMVTVTATGPYTDAEEVREWYFTF